MGNGVSSASRSDEDDILSSPFPTFGGFTIEEATVNDIIKGRSLCANIVKLTRGYKPVDEADFMNHFAPMILFYDQFYEELVAQRPNSVLLSKSMLFRLTFLSELIANMLSLDCTANEEENSVSCRVEASFEQREMLQQWVAKYESEDIYQSECEEYDRNQCLSSCDHVLFISSVQLDTFSYSCIVLFNQMATSARQ